MPSAASLAKGEYYAHPRNAFWKIMSALVGANPDAAYRDRVAALRESGIALWDVVAECERRGSLDSAIRNARQNDIAGFLAKHPGVRIVALNGGKARDIFHRDIFPQLPERRRNGLRIASLPSTSPANAGMTFAQKRAEWLSALSPHLG